VILVVSFPDDPHAAAVGQALDRLGEPWGRIDLADFPDRASLAFSYGPKRVPDFRLRPRRGPELRLGEVRAAWWRRPRPFSPHGVVSPEHRRFAEREWRDATLGLWRALRIPWVNDPVAADVAALKTWQLALAQDVGLPIPRTIVTSDPRRARAFVGGGRPRIYKTLHSERGLWRPTRRVGPGERRLLGAVRHAPVIFQELIPGVDVRVTVVGRRLFPVEIDARRSGSPDDFRMDFAGSKVRACRLPADLERRMLGMTRRLGLSYAAFDLRRRRNGGHVFLEVNPGGQWLGVEEISGLPITDALARLLATAARRRPTARPSPWLP
jgi:glutathione synthase/RimK-type ligase-like ATP-grasp enzyme